ncbi:MAG: hypothetical protein L3J25_07270 [Flavobacteriaceae bacterium]|nr:hypothetical protein [Flavobacteriaceae bacterium]
MNKVILALSLMLGCLTFSKAQTNLNDYKYVIVPNKFDFLKEADKYQLNSLTKFLFNKYGFEAFMVNEQFPQDLVKNACLSLRSEVINDSGMFKTKLMVVLKNCNNEIIFTSRVGETKEKEFKKAYNLALRDAFISFETINYSYKPNDKMVAETRQIKPTTTQEIEKLKEEIKTLKEEKYSSIKVSAKVEDKKVEIVEETVVVPEVKKVNTVKTSNVLYVQEIVNGFQIVDSTPKIVMILLVTPKQDVFIVKGKDAIVYKEDGFWYLSENNGLKTTTKTLNIKF